MNATLRLSALAIVMMFALPSCVSKKKFDQLAAEKAALANSLADSQNKVKTLEGKVSELETEVSNQKTEMANQKSKFESDIAGLRKSVDEANSNVTAAKKALADKEAEMAKFKKDVKESFGLSDLPIVEENGDLVVALSSPVNFPNGSARLTKSDLNAIDSLAMTLKSHPDRQLVIQGFTDTKKYPKGASMDNWQLSYDRALMVAKRLIKKGVNPNQLTIAGRGEFDPIAPNDTKDGRAKNRRTIAKPDVDINKVYKLVN